jgi:hypothetical protein
VRTGHSRLPDAQRANKRSGWAWDFRPNLPLRPVRWGGSTGRTARSLRKRANSAPQVLNEASAYGSAFTRGLRVDLPGGVTQLLISGTASVGENGETLYPGDFHAQLWRTYQNITKLRESEGARSVGTAPTRAWGPAWTPKPVPG